MSRIFKYKFLIGEWNSDFWGGGAFKRIWWGRHCRTYPEAQHQLIDLQRPKVNFRRPKTLSLWPNRLSKVQSWLLDANRAYIRHIGLRYLCSKINQLFSGRKVVPHLICDSRTQNPRFLRKIKHLQRPKIDSSSYKGPKSTPGDEKFTNLGQIDSQRSKIDSEMPKISSPNLKSWPIELWSLCSKINYLFSCRKVVRPLICDTRTQNLLFLQGQIYT